MRRPTMRIGNPLPTSLPQETRKAVKIFRSFVNPSEGLDGIIPASVLRSAHGFAIFTVVKAGFLMSVRAGTGLVIARLPSGQWSAPSAIGTGGMGFGGQAGAEVTEFILVLNSQSALRQFMSAGSITLGGNLSVALGPIGRNMEGSGALNTKGKLAAMYSYSKTKGAFAGISIEGSAIFERQDCNVKSYGSNVTATKLLSGQIESPSFAAELIEVLTSRAGSLTEYLYHGPQSLIQEPNSHSVYKNPFQEGENPLSDTAFRDEFNSSTRSPEPHQLGPQNSSKPSTKRPGMKKSFSVSSWRSSPKNDRKYISDFHNVRTGSPGHWVETIETHAQEDKWRVDGGLNHEVVRSSPYDPSKSPNHLTGSRNNSTQELGLIKLGHIRQDTTPISEIDGIGFYSNSKANEFDRLTLSSMGSDDDHVEALNHHWSDDEREQSNPGSNPKREQLADTKKNSKWYSCRKNSSSRSSGRAVPVGMVDDLISFDQIGPPSPTYPFQSSHHSDSAQDPPIHNDTQFGIHKTGSDRAPSRSQNSLSRSSNHVKEAAVKEEEESDFLVGTGLPSVMRTKTDLAGFLGKAVGLYDFDGTEPGDLSFKKGDLINVVEKTDNQWWMGSIGLRKGIFPVNRVQVAMK